MKGIQQAVLEKAVRLLDSLKLEYVIVVSDDVSIIKGNIEITSQKKSRNITAPRGTYSSLFKECGVNEMKVGDVLIIPCGKLDPAMVQRACAAYCYNQWGSRSSMSSVDGNSVEVMRIENGE
jgi:hypothetical protein